MGTVASWKAQGLVREHGHSETPGHRPRLTRSAEFSKEDKIHICKEYHLVIQGSRKPSVGQVKKALLKMYGLGFWDACGGHNPESGWGGV